MIQSHLTALSFALLLILSNVVTSRVALYEACDVGNNHLDVDTKAFITDCDSFGYCSANGTCLPRQCRRDEFVLTSLLDASVPAPPLCSSTDSFCPDDASGCLPLVPVGGQCELNRDDECAPPPLINGITSVPNPYGDGVSNGNDNGVICLLGQCVLSNVTLGGTCRVESTTYIGYDVSGLNFSNIVTRDNCIQGQGYYDTTTFICEALLLIGQKCDSDRQCQSYNCENGICILPPQSETLVPNWVFGISGLIIFLCMTGILLLLIMIHKRKQESNRIILDNYYKEQMAYRNSILSFHSALSSREKDKL